MEDQQDQEVKQRVISKEEKEELLKQKKIQEEEEQRKINEAKKRAQDSLKKRNKKFDISDYSYHIVIGGFAILCIIAIASVVFSDRRKLTEIPVNEEDVIKAHNAAGYPYLLGEQPFFQDWKLSDAKTIINNTISNKPTLPRCIQPSDTSILPSSFNFNELYPDCATQIYEQGNCSSSYAIVAATTLSNRLCFKTSNTEIKKLAPQAILSCNTKGLTCKGGAVTSAFDFIKKEGIAEEDCLPYAGKDETCPESYKQCQKYQLKDYCVTGGSEDKPKESIELIKRDIKANGPVIAVIPIYRDFLIYKSGIYTVPEGMSRFKNGHAIKIIGWDREGDQEYWIAENSWGEKWGINGTVHIGTGQKQLFIEQFVISPNPALKESDKDEDNDEEDATPKEETAEKLDLDDNEATAQ